MNLLVVLALVQVGDSLPVIPLQRNPASIIDVPHVHWSENRVSDLQEIFKDTTKAGVCVVLARNRYSRFDRVTYRGISVRGLEYWSAEAVIPFSYEAEFPQCNLPGERGMYYFRRNIGDPDQNLPLKRDLGIQTQIMIASQPNLAVVFIVWAIKNFPDPLQDRFGRLTFVKVPWGIGTYVLSDLGSCRIYNDMDSCRVLRPDSPRDVKET